MVGDPGPGYTATLRYTEAEMDGVRIERDRYKAHLVNITRASFQKNTHDLMEVVKETPDVLRNTNAP